MRFSGGGGGTGRLSCLKVVLLGCLRLSKIEDSKIYPNGVPKCILMTLDSNECTGSTSRDAARLEYRQEFKYVLRLLMNMYEPYSGPGRICSTNWVD